VLTSSQSLSNQFTRSFIWRPFLRRWRGTSTRSHRSDRRTTLLRAVSCTCRVNTTIALRQHVLRTRSRGLRNVLHCSLLNWLIVSSVCIFLCLSVCAHTHTSLTALCPGLPGWAGTRKEKQIWILLKQETVSGSGISWAICKSAPRSRQITPHRSVFYRPDALPAAQPTATKHWRHPCVCWYSVSLLFIFLKLIHTATPDTQWRRDMTQWRCANYTTAHLLIT